MSKNVEILNSFADFTWMFDKLWFVKAPDGNFIWSDPDYGGDNTFTKYRGDYGKFNKEYYPYSFGRAKGKHRISDYCGDQIKIR